MTTTRPPLPTLDRIVRDTTGRALVWLAKRAVDRRDWHESNHCIAALAVGDSDHDGPCGLPTDKPLRRVPVASWEPYPTDPEPAPETFRHEAPCDLTGCASAHPEEHHTGTRHDLRAHIDANDPDIYAVVPGCARCVVRPTTPPERHHP